MNIFWTSIGRVQCFWECPKAPTLRAQSPKQEERMIKKQSFTPRLYGFQIDFDQYFWEWPFNRVFPTPHKLPMSCTGDYMPAYCNEGVPWCEWVASPRQMPQMSRPFSLLHPRPPCLSSFSPLLILLLSFMFHFLIGIQIERKTRSSSYLMNFNTITFLPFICSAFFHFAFKWFNFGCISCFHVDY